MNAARRTIEKTCSANTRRRAATVAVAACALAAPLTAARAQSDARSRIDTTFAFAKGGWVDLGISTGEIVVTAWNRSEARVVARIERGTLDLGLSSSRISIGTSRGRRGGEARYELMVPVGTRVQANAASGDIRVKGTGAEVQLQTSSGDIEVTDAADRIEIGSSSGDLHAQKLRGRTRMSSTSGDLIVDDVVGDLSIRTVSGEVEISHAKSAHVRAETTSGDITYEGTIEPKGEYDFSAHSGGVRLDIPAGSNANLELQTWSGNISSQFPMTLQPGDRNAMGHGSMGHGQRFEFTIGNGGARITANSFSGDITIGRTGRTTKED